MTFWNLYFILKLYLFAAGHLKPLWIANLGFALALALSAPARRRGVRLLRHALALALAVPLMYREADAATRAARRNARRPARVQRRLLDGARAALRAADARIGRARRRDRLSDRQSLAARGDVRAARADRAAGVAGGQRGARAARRGCRGRARAGRNGPRRAAAGSQRGARRVPLAGIAAAGDVRPAERRSGDAVRRDRAACVLAVVGRPRRREAAQSSAARPFRLSVHEFQHGGELQRPGRDPRAARELRAGGARGPVQARARAVPSVRATRGRRLRAADAAQPRRPLRQLSPVDPREHRRAERADDPERGRARRDARVRRLGDQGRLRDARELVRETRREPRPRRAVLQHDQPARRQSADGRPDVEPRFVPAARASCWTTSTASRISLPHRGGAR